MSLLALLAPVLTAAAGYVRDGALKFGKTHPTRFMALVLLIVGCGVALHRQEALWVGLAFAPGMWWAPWHGKALRFGENGGFDWEAFAFGLGNSAILLFPPACVLLSLHVDPIPLYFIGLAGRPVAYWLGWWAERRGWLQGGDSAFPGTRAGHVGWFLAIGVGLVLVGLL
jgi:hypothetical protein